jgi:phage recombination protein Bet
MSTEVAVIEQGHVPNVSWTNEQVELIKRTIAVGATNDELQLFLHQAKRTGLDPLSRQIHFVKRKDKGTIQTAIDGYRLIADRTGKYAGSDDYLFDEGIPQYLHMIGKRGNPVTATVTVYKMCDGSRTAFTATAAWGEYFPGEAQGFMWKKMPYLMIGKCAEALALRKAFPAELSGIYTNEEMMQAQPSEAIQAHVVESDPNEPCVPNYGPDAGKPFSQVPTRHLEDYLAGAERSIKDPKKANFLKKNETMRDLLRAEIEKRVAAEQENKPEPQAAGQAEQVGTPQASDRAPAPFTTLQWNGIFAKVETDPDLCELKEMVKSQLGIETLLYGKTTPEMRTAFVTAFKKAAADNNIADRLTAIGL